MTLPGTRFGVIEFEAGDILAFPDGLIGFESERRFVTVAVAPESPFRWLQSLDTPGLAFLMADPDAFVELYCPRLPAREAQRLRVDDRTPYFLWVTANIPPGDPHGMTLNLAGPIVVNPEKGLGRQVVLDDEAYTIRHRAFARRPKPREALAA